MAEETEVTLPVHFRPARSSWIGVVFLCLLGLFLAIGPFAFPTPPSRNPPSTFEVVFTTAFLGLFGLMLLLLAAWEALWIHRGEIVADNTGLRWRDVGEWHRAPWSQVRDYYEDTLRRRCAVIETDAGTLRISRGRVSNTPAFRAAIQQHAQWTLASDWEVLGTRPEIDWPSTFKYTPGTSLWGRIISNGISILWFSAFAWGYVKSWHTWAEIWEYSSPILVVVGTTVYFACALIFPAVSWVNISMLREARSRMAEQITVTPSGLIFEDGSRRIECAWEEITDYYRDPMLPNYSGDDHYVVVMAHETFDYTLIANNRLLSEIIKRHAKNALYGEWRDYRPQQETGGKGERIYNYRTRMNRTLMLIPLSVIPICGLIPFILPNQEIENPNSPNLWIVGIMISPYVIGLVIFCAAYFIGSIEISDDGISQRGLRGKKFLAWDHVTQLRRTKMGNYEIQGGNIRLGFYPSIADVRILFDEITRRSTKAEIMPSWTQSELP